MTGSKSVRALTAHQLGILRRIAEGDAHAEIARDLSMTEKGLQAGVSRVLRKLGARNAPHAVHLAHQAGLLDSRPERHGDHAGFQRHVRAGEDPYACEFGCPEGERAYRTLLRSARKVRASASRGAA
jgi:DNA-binding CsgD family transcriptional regulator